MEISPAIALEEHLQEQKNNLYIVKSNKFYCETQISKTNNLNTLKGTIGSL